MKPFSFYCFLILFMGFTLIPATAQESIGISGVVTTFGNFPLKNVSLQSQKAGHIVHTDSLGQFVIQCLKKDILLVTASGFDGKRKRIRKADPVKINLVYSNEETSFALATSNNHISAELLEEAISTKPAKGQKDYSIYSDIYELIDNEIHNVKVDGRSVTTTKIHSIQMSSDVLFVVDGVMNGDVTSISPLIVKSIRFVDGVGASAYGAKGANGIIEIVTKN